MESEREQRIRERAYEIWEREGRPEGQEMAHWEQAEREVSGELLKHVPEGQSPEHSGGVASGLQAGAAQQTDDPAAGAEPASGATSSRKRS